MQMISKVVLVAILCLSFVGTALGAVTPNFGVDFYDPTTLAGRGVYDTNTNFDLSSGESVRVDILVSDIRESDPNIDTYLSGWGFKLLNGDGYTASNLEVNTEIWTELSNDIFPSENQELLGIEGWFTPSPTNDTAAASGDNILLFSFDLTATDTATRDFILTLVDYDESTNTTVTSDQDNGLDHHLPVELATINGGANPVPVPAAVWMLGSGLTGLLAYRRRQSTK